MKSKAQKRQEARERIERSLPDVEAQLKLTESAWRAIGEPLEPVHFEVEAAYQRLKARVEYMRAEIERIKNREANPRKRKQADVLSLVA